MGRSCVLVSGLSIAAFPSRLSLFDVGRIFITMWLNIARVLILFSVFSPLHFTFSSLWLSLEHPSSFVRFFTFLSSLSCLFFPVFGRMIDE